MEVNNGSMIVCEKILPTEPKKKHKYTGKKLSMFSITSDSLTRGRSLMREWSSPKTTTTRHKLEKSEPLLIFVTVSRLGTDPWCYWCRSCFDPCQKISSVPHTNGENNCDCEHRCDAHSVTVSEKHIWMSNVHFCQLVMILAILTLYITSNIFWVLTVDRW